MTNSKLLTIYLKIYFISEIIRYIDVGSYLEINYLFQNYGESFLFGLGTPFFELFKKK